MLEGGGVELEALEEGAGGDEVLQPREFRAGEHRGRARGVVENGGDDAPLPQRDEDDGGGVDVGQQDTDAHGGGGWRGARLRDAVAHELCANEQLAIGELGLRGVLEDDLARLVGGGLRNGRRHGGRAEVHLRIELLADHLVAEPAGEERAALGRAEMLLMRGREEVAEVDGDAGEAPLPAGVGGEGQALRAAHVGSDDLGVGLVDEEAGAVEELHQGSRAREAAFREEHELAALGEEFCHVLHGVGRGVVDREGARVQHHELVEPGFLRGGRGRDELPVTVQTHAEEQPVEPGGVVGDEQDRAGGAEGGLVERAEAEEQADEEAEECFHGIA